MSDDDPVRQERCVQFDANVDDLDPRLWPHVIERLLDAGADDAWVTPIVMKKGRPAFTVSAMCSEENAEAMRSVIFRETSTIGVRESVRTKHVLDRADGAVEIGGEHVGTKTARLDGEVVNRSVEWDDVVAVAHRLGLSAKQVLALATAAAIDVEG